MDAAAYRELQRILNQWDPIGVYGTQHPDFEWPDDEYDCLLPPLERLLDARAPATEVAAFLDSELRGHFGLTTYPDPGEFAVKLTRLFARR